MTRRAITNMHKKRRGRLSKVKRLEPVVTVAVDNKTEKTKVSLPEKPVVTATPLCDCGKPAHPGSAQCWGCSHRA